jgi:hypothetical protein
MLRFIPALPEARTTGTEHAAEDITRSWFFTLGRYGHRFNQADQTNSGKVLVHDHAPM